MTHLVRQATLAVLILSAIVGTVRGEHPLQNPPRTVSIYVESPNAWWSLSSKAPAFELAIDGTPVEIVRTVGGPQTLAAVMLFDVSGSVSDFDERGTALGKLDLGRAAKQIAGARRPDDRFHLGTIGPKVAIAKTLLVDPKTAAKVADEIRQRGGASPLWDAIDGGLAAVFGQPGLHAVIVHTDGQAAGNDISSEEILTRALKAGVSVSAVGVADIGLPEGRQRVNVQIMGRNDRLQRLVRETGGSYLELNVPEQEPVDSFVWMLNRLRKSYRLDFVPPTRDSRLHEVSATVGGKAAKTAKFVGYR